MRRESVMSDDVAVSYGNQGCRESWPSVSRQNHLIRRLARRTSYGWRALDVCSYVTDAGSSCQWQCARGGGAGFRSGQGLVRRQECR